MPNRRECKKSYLIICPVANSKSHSTRFFSVQNTFRFQWGKKFFLIARRQQTLLLSVLNRNGFYAESSFGTHSVLWSRYVLGVSTYCELTGTRWQYYQTHKSPIVLQHPKFYNLCIHTTRLSLLPTVPSLLQRFTRHLKVEIKVSSRNEISIKDNL